MAGYVENQVALAQRQIADAISGKRLQKAIKQLQDRSQLRDSLKDLPARGAITAKRRIGKRTATSQLSTELRELRSSDGLFTLQYEHVIGLS